MGGFTITEIFIQYFKNIVFIQSCMSSKFGLKKFFCIKANYYIIDPMQHN